MGFFLAGGQRLGHGGQHAVDVGGVVLAAVGLGQLHGLVDGHAGGDGILPLHLVNGQAQQGQGHLGEAAQAPAADVLLDDAVDLLPVGLHAQGLLLCKGAGHQVPGLCGVVEDSVHRLLPDGLLKHQNKGLFPSFPSCHRDDLPNKNKKSPPLPR